MKHFLIVVCIFLSSCAAKGSNFEILTQNIVNSKKDTFEIDRNYDLGGKTITIPRGLVIKFKGGIIDRGTLKGNNTKIVAPKKNILFGLNIYIDGTWNVSDVYDSWFEFNSKQDYISNQVIKNILKFSNDKAPCHIHFDEDRVYYFSLQTNMPANIGNQLSKYIENGKTKYNYKEIFEEKYSYLRLFTIPSNTHVTFNNKLQMLPTNQGVYFVFWEYGKENITIDGVGEISGDAQTHLYTSSFFKNTNYYGEWGYLFRCSKCKNFTFQDVTLSNSFGDLLSYNCSIVEKEEGDRYSSDLTVQNVRFVRARRNGISMSAKNVVVKNCFFLYCGTDMVKGTAPRAAIDFENSYVNKYLGTGNENVIMDNCVFVNNKHDISATNVNVPNYGKTAITIRNCLFTSPVRLNPTPHWIKFENCTIPSFTNWQSRIDQSTPIKCLEFVNCHIKSIPKLLIDRQWRNRFTDCVIDHKE